LLVDLSGGGFSDLDRFAGVAGKASG